MKPLVDALGRRHQPFDGVPRIVSLVPSLTELICDLGLADCLVGRTGFCIHPREALRQVPKVGGTKDVKLERVRELAPTHLIADIDENRREAVEAMMQFVPQVVVVHPQTVDDNLALYALLGGIFGREADAARLAAEFAAARTDLVFPLPGALDALHAAPLLCAGIIGYRSLLRAQLPSGGRLGLYGFGGSAHITAQVALAQGSEVHVMTRGAQARRLALELGAASVQGAADPPPVKLDAAILFAPVGDLVLPALEALDRGGTLAVAGIHLSDIPALNYQRHLFQERQIRSVTSNTRDDAREFLTFAGRHRIEVTSPEYPLEQADRALTDLVEGRIAGAAVLLP